jgi:hypothetical protein
MLTNNALFVLGRVTMAQFLRFGPKYFFVLLQL